MEQEEIIKPEGGGGNLLKTALKVLLGALVVLAIVVGGVQLVQKMTVKQPSEKQEQTDTVNTGGGFPTPAVSSPTSQTTDGPKVFGQSQAGQLPASGPPLLSLIMLGGAGLAGIYLTKKN